MNDAMMPQHDKEAEQGVLGCAIRDRVALVELLALIRADEFYCVAHQNIWLKFEKMVAAGKNVDPVTLLDELGDDKAVEEIGGRGYIVHIWDNASPNSWYHDHLTIVKKLALKRGLNRVGQAIMAIANDKSTDADEAMEAAESELFQFSQSRHGGSDVATMLEMVRDGRRELDRRALHRAGDELPMGFIDLDRATSGLKRKELVVVGARPSVGKTVFALNVAENLAKLGKKVFFASLEQSKQELFERMLSRNTGIDSFRFRMGQFAKSEAATIHDATESLEKYRLIVDDHGSQTAARIASQARRQAVKGQLDLVIVDYLGLMEAEDRRANRYVQVGTCCRRMKQLAKELNAPVMLLAQLSRESDSRRPGLVDLRESGDIEQHADTVLLLHKDQSRDHAQANDELEVLCRKQRNGPLFDAKLLHRKAYFDIANFSPGLP